MTRFLAGLLVAVLAAAAAAIGTRCGLAWPKEQAAVAGLAAGLAVSVMFSALSVRWSAAGTQSSILMTVFLAGASLMSLEMASFRLSEPVFGSDIAVWGSLISVFLGGLAVGAMAGGRLADWRPGLAKLGIILVAGGAVTLLIPSCYQAVFDWTFPGEGAPLPAEWGTGGGTDGTLNVYVPPDLRWPALLAGTMLFGIPAILLGMASPYAARLFVHELQHMGGGVGQVYGISTIGSIVGTLGTAFYLVSWLGTRRLLEANGMLLVALGIALAIAAALRRQTPETHT
jgi:predicted membrane-bound spermidine synthase